jgi:hypothetical protein
MEIACFIGAVHSRVTGNGTFAVSASTPVEKSATERTTMATAKIFESRRTVIKRQR